MADFATRLRELRTKRGLRQVDLAEALGVAQTTVANYEKKLRFPDERMLGRVADFFGVGMDFLLGRTATESEATGGNHDVRGPATELSGDARRYLELVRGNRTEQAFALVTASLAGGGTLSKVYLEVLEPALKETGRLWERGELQVGEEHAISLATQRIMSRMSVAPPRRHRAASAPSCLVMAVSGEHHVIGPTMVGDLLRADGWNVLFPGGNLSVRHALELLTRSAPQLVALSATTAENVAGADDLISAIRGHARGRTPRILVGGQAFGGRPRLWQEIGADATAADAADAVRVSNRLVNRGG